MPAGLPRIGAVSKPHHYKQNVHKTKDLSKTWVSPKNCLKNSDGKKTRNITLELSKKTLLKTRPLNTIIEYGPCNQEEVNRKQKKSIKIKTVGTLRRTRTQESKSWYVQLLCNLGWSWHDHWRWHNYHVQTKIIRPMIAKKLQKKKNPFENMKFNGKTVWRLQTKKRTETIFSTLQKSSVEHSAPKSNYSIGIW